MRENHLRRTLIRGGPTTIYRWPEMPPEAPCPAYTVHTPDPDIYMSFPTLAQAVTWADRLKCPLLQAIPFTEA